MEVASRVDVKVAIMDEKADLNVAFQRLLTYAERPTAGKVRRSFVDP